MATTGKTYSAAERKARILKYCAYRERCHAEVRSKLYDLGANSEEVNLLIAELIELNYLNEERFAKAFCRGKFLHNKWGRMKILQALKLKQISAYCIQSGMKEIDAEEYSQLLRGLLSRAMKQSTTKNPYKQKADAARKLIQKGFEPDLVWDYLKEGGYE